MSEVGAGGIVVVVVSWTVVVVVSWTAVAVVSSTTASWPVPPQATIKVTRVLILFSYS